MTSTITAPARPVSPPTSSPSVHVLIDRCAGCQECIIRCPREALQLDPVTWTAVADDALCVGCRQCVRTCPFSAIFVEGPEVVAPRVHLDVVHPQSLVLDRSETRRPIASWTEALAEANRCLQCPDPTCVRGCPVHNDIPGFIREVREGDLDKAHKILRRTSVLPDVCSRVCDQATQCEGACSWSLADGDPVAIGALERFVADNAPVPPYVAPAGDSAAGSRNATSPAPHVGSSRSARVSGEEAGSGLGLEVAIVGSGPAGIGAAAELVRAGARVTVYERDPAPGGLLRWGIPDFTLPEAVKRRPWEQLRDAGVELSCGKEISDSDLASLAEDYDAVIVATGASVPLRLPVEGGDLEGIWDATRFLQAAQGAIASGEEISELKPRPVAGVAGQSTRPATVLVLGAGNTAMDVARSARRLGAEAVCVDWMDRRFAPVRPDELEEAAAEGVDVQFATTLRRLDGADGHVRRAELARTRQRSAGERPEVVDGPPVRWEVDLVVMAMGYRIAPDVAELGHGVPVRKAVPRLADRHWQASGILANPGPRFARHQAVGKLALGREHALTMSLLPRSERIWFAGDALVGPSTVVEAMAHGKAAAQAICHHRPRRPSRGAAGLMHVLVVTASRGGRTKALSDELAGRLQDMNLEVRSVTIEEAGLDELAWADALVLGSWVEGAVVARVGPAKQTRAWLAGLPPLPGMPTVIYCTYAVAPKGTLGIMREALARQGAVVLAEAAFGPGARTGAASRRGAGATARPGSRRGAGSADGELARLARVLETAGAMTT